MKIKYIFCVFLSVFLIGCKNTPSDEDVFSLLKERHSSSSLSKMSNILNIKKTNGFQESENKYIVDVEYDLVANITFKEFDDTIRKKFKADSKGLSSREKLELSRKILSDNRDVITKFKNFDKGTLKHYEEKITLIDTEKGWKIK